MTSPEIKSIDALAGAHPSYVLLLDIVMQRYHDRFGVGATDKSDGWGG